MRITPGEQHHPGNAVIGQPRLSARGQQAGEDHSSGIGLGDHRTQQRMRDSGQPDVADISRS
ncbi:hypothetical protein [Mycobacterium marinum]|uniref:hypothetical protein n=1 Tax=Mycobacterium marinum TaxID=1781 RepID=UPI001FB6EBCA|nr:hypothetical protein [Mycobacterium marinum]